MPPSVIKLCRLLSSAAENTWRVVPRALQNQVESYPNSIIPLEECHWSTDLDATYNYSNQWKHVVYIFEEAARLNMRQDEEGWNSLVSRALGGVNLDQRTEQR